MRDRATGVTESPASAPGSQGVSVLSWQGQVLVLFHPELSNDTVNVQGSPTVRLVVNRLAGAVLKMGMCVGVSLFRKWGSDARGQLQRGKEERKGSETGSILHRPRRGYKDLREETLTASQPRGRMRRPTGRSSFSYR